MRSNEIVMANPELIRLNHIHPRLVAREDSNGFYVLMDMKHLTNLMSMSEKTFQTAIVNASEDIARLEATRDIINIMCDIDDIGYVYDLPDKQLRMIDGCGFFRS